MLSFFPMFLLLIVLLSLNQVRGARVPYHLKYRQDLQFQTPFPSSASIVDFSEALTLDMADHRQNGLVDSDCGDIVFFLFRNGETSEDEPLNWWAETPCPGDGMDTFVTFWIDIPQDFDPGISGHVISMLFGSTQGYVNNFKSSMLQHNFGLGIELEEVRFYNSALCPATGFTREQGWQGKYVTGTEFPSKSAGLIVDDDTHTHQLMGDDVRCDFTKDAGSGYIGTNEICMYMENSTTATVYNHSHMISEGRTYTYVETTNAVQPPSFRLTACSLPYDPPNTVSYIAPIDFTSFVGAFTHNALGAGWIEHANSKSNFFAIGEWGGTNPTTAIPHSHGSSDYGSTFTKFGTDVDSGMSDAYAFSGSLSAAYGDHSHLLWSVDVKHVSVDSEHVPYVEVWFHEAPDGLFSTPASPNSNTWYTSKVPDSLIHFFAINGPPLGYINMNDKTKSNGVDLMLRGMIASTQEQIGLENPSVPMSGHSHYLEDFTMLYEATPSISANVDDTVEDCENIEVGTMTWGWGMAYGVAHWHTDCIGGTNPSVDMSGDLPNRVYLGMYIRKNVPERPIVGLGDLLLSNDPTGGMGDGGSNLDTGTIIGIAAGSGSGLLFAVIVIIILILLIIVCVKRKNNMNRGEFPLTNKPKAETTPTPDSDFVEVEMSEARKSSASLDFSLDVFTIPYSSIKTGRTIGKGGSNSYVFEAMWSGQRVAFKCFTIADFMGDDEKFREFENEVNLMIGLNHPNILQFFGAALEEPRVGILMEYCPHGDLNDYIVASECVSADRLRLLRETASGMLYLHSKGIIHRDLKPENVLIAKDYSAKVCDFGLSRIIEDELQTKTRRVGTSYYMAPDVFEGHYDNKIDVFSFGIMLWTVLSGNFRPYGDAFNPEVKVCADPSFRPRVYQSGDEDTFEEVWDDDEVRWCVPLMQRCWDADKDVRPTFEEVLEVFATNMDGTGQQSTGLGKK